MKIAIDLIKVDDDIRIRKEIGNLQPLVDSINKVGLINPILIDEQSNLVAGYRRLAACRKLGMEEVEVRIVEFDGDLMKMLDVEVAENFFRKDFTPEEVLATERRRQEIIEATRKKGLLERFWLWLKSLFAPSPVGPKNAGTTSQSMAEKVDPPHERDGKDAETEPAETQKKTVQQPVYEPDNRSIKWRTS